MIYITGHCTFVQGAMSSDVDLGMEIMVDHDLDMLTPVFHGLAAKCEIRYGDGRRILSLPVEESRRRWTCMALHPSNYYTHKHTTHTTQLSVDNVDILTYTPCRLP
jgi:hypothetical protein